MIKLWRYRPSCKWHIKYSTPYQTGWELYDTFAICGKSTRPEYLDVTEEELWCLDIAGSVCKTCVEEYIKTCKTKETRKNEPT